MTGNTRKYLADLANRKGITLPAGFQDADQASASAKIDELKNLPDASFGEISESATQKIAEKTERIIQGIYRWTLEES